MSERKSISKKIRFEVFKRDKFTCQYCGRKAPEIVLQIDHIDPVSQGGDNEIINLITSCFDCNSGKRDRTLDDNSVLYKQRKQLELIQERREQIELMFEWKKSLSELDSEIINLVAEYVNSKIQPLSLNENGKFKVEQLLKKFDIEDILNGIDASSDKYLKFINGELQRESIEEFINKIGGIIAVKNMPPIKQKLAYIKGIARKRFSYWDDRKGSIILNNYVTALKEHWTEDQIVSDLDNEVTQITKEAKNWTQWKDKLEGWTEDVNKWEKRTKGTPSSKKEFSIDDLRFYAAMTRSEQNDSINAILHLGSLFPNFDKEKFYFELNNLFLTFLETYNDFENHDDNYETAIWNFIYENQLNEYFNYDIENSELKYLEILQQKAMEILFNVFNWFYYPKLNYSRKDAEIIIMFHIDALKNK